MNNFLGGLSLLPRGREERKMNYNMPDVKPCPNPMCSSTKIDDIDILYESANQRVVIECTCCHFRMEYPVEANLPIKDVFEKAKWLVRTWNSIPRGNN